MSRARTRTGQRSLNEIAGPPPLPTVSLLATATLALGLLGSCSSASEDPSEQVATGSASAGDLGEEQQVESLDASDRTVRPSAGCNSGAVDTTPGPSSLPLSDGQTGEFIVTFPSSYDGSEPLPLMFAFHGANNRPADCYAANCGGVNAAATQEVITLYMGSLAPSWTDTALDSNVQYFDELLQFAKDNYCIDERRVTALGTSSGAHFSNILACRRGNDLMAIVPGAGEAFERDDNAQCQGEVAALVIHGVADTSVPFDGGEAARDYYAQRNGCDSTTTPELAPLHAEVEAAFDAGESITRCVDFDGCREGLPVRWCEHSEPGYDGSTHGWPSTGGPEAIRFIQSLY